MLTLTLPLVLQMGTTIIQHTKESATAKWEEAYKMIPIRICDSLLNTEEKVV